MLDSRRAVALVLVLVVALGGCAANPGLSPGASAAASTENPSPGSSATAPTDGETAQSGTTASPQPTGTLEVHFINVGQGASTLIISPSGETMLIDTGDWQDDGEHVIEYLDELGVDRIDHLVTTHADADHIGGHAAVIEYYETEKDGIGAVYDPGITSSSATYDRYLDAIEEYDVPLYETRAGDTLPFEGVDVSVLGPPEPYLADGDRNENSIVLRVKYGETSFLFMGDGEDDMEKYLLEQYGSQLNVTVLQVGHHGSRSSTGETFLDVTTPRVAVISSAYDSQYDHPHTEPLERLAARSIPTYWTATHGTTALRSNGSAVEVWTQQPAPTTATELREGSPIDPGSSEPLEYRSTFAVALADGGSTTSPTPTATPKPEGDTPTSVSDSGTLSLVDIHEDAAGDENDNLNDEYIVFENTGGAPLDLSGWQVSDEVDHTYTFPEGFSLDPGDRVTLHTGSGTNTDTDLYWGSGSAIWNNGGDTVTVTDSSGEVVFQEEYS